MIVHETKVRVRYGETDQMGVVYYGRYAEYFEVSRAEMIRQLGYSYSEMEADGVIMPVTEMRVRYLRPALYDEMLTLKAILREVPDRRITIVTQVLNEAGKLCVEGVVTLAFVDKALGKAVSAPRKFVDILRAHWPDTES